MPQLDPRPGASLRRQLARVMRVGAALAILTAALAIVMVARGQSRLHIEMLIAAALGIGLAVLIAAAVTTLIFLSHRRGTATASERRSESNHQ